MKSKITSILMILAAPLLAFAESNVPAPVAAEKPAVRENGKIQARRGAMFMHMLLMLNDEQLDELEKRIAQVRKMTPEEKLEALKALPKPEVRRPRSLEREFRGNRNGRGPRGKEMPAPKGKPDKAEKR